MGLSSMSFPCLNVGVCTTAPVAADSPQSPELLVTPQRGPVPASASPGLGAPRALQPPSNSTVLSESPGGSFRRFPAKVINSHFFTMEISTGLGVCIKVVPKTMHPETGHAPCLSGSTLPTHSQAPRVAHRAGLQPPLLPTHFTQQHH